MERDGRILLSIGTQIGRDMVAEIDAVAQKEGGSRSDAIRKLLRLGLDRYEHRERIVNALESAQQVPA